MHPPQAAPTQDSPQIKSLSKSSQDKTGAMWVLAVLIALAAALRFLYLARKSFWFDEGVSVQIARLDWYNFLRILWRREANMSLYYLLLRGWLHFGGNEAFVRSLSVLFAVLTVPAIYSLGQKLLDRRTAQFAALLLCVNGFHIAYSQEARSYSLFVLLTTVSAWFFVESCQNPLPRNLRLYITATGLAVYAHLFAFLMIPVEWLSARMSDCSNTPQMQRNWRWIAILTSPMFLFAVTTGAGPLAWIPRPGVHDLYVLFVSLCGGGWVLVLLYLAACALAFLPAFPDPIPDAQKSHWSVRFLLCWIAFPVLTMFVVSQFRPLFLTRYFLFVLPALVLLAARGVTRLPSRWLMAGFLAIVLVLSLHADRHYYAQALNLEHEDWRSAVSYVVSNSHDGDALIFHTAMGRMPFEYYRDRRPGPSVLFPNSGNRITYRDFMGHPDVDLLASSALQYRRTWIVFSHNQGKPPAQPDTPTRRLTQLLGNSYSKVEMQSFPGVEVYLYSGPSSPRP